jgi:hypothetical protein
LSLGSNVVSAPLAHHNVLAFFTLKNGRHHFAGTVESKQRFKKKFSRNSSFVYLNLLVLAFGKRVVKLVNTKKESRFIF